MMKNRVSEFVAFALLTMFVLAVPLSALGALSIDATSSKASVANVTSSTLSFTVTSTANELLLVGVAIDNAVSCQRSIASVTYKGTTMTQAVDNPDTADCTDQQ